jgi:hypothetical protein
MCVDWEGYLTRFWASSTQVIHIGRSVHIRKCHIGSYTAPGVNDRLMTRASTNQKTRQTVVGELVEAGGDPPISFRRRGSTRDNGHRGAAIEQPP